ncbi:hypothetical protein HVIM_04231 [Roseomonas mucosa]|nr:hypothetical protein HVIM_04231 [Roseomonas mucosa]
MQPDGLLPRPCPSRHQSSRWCVISTMVHQEIRGPGVSHAE